MKYIFIATAISLITNSGQTIKNSRSKKEKREYSIEKLPNGIISKKLNKTSTYTTNGLVISETEECSDSICCPYNKSFSLHKNKNEYWYKDNRIALRIFRTCDSLPSYKNFYEYKFDSKKRLSEEKELTFNYETDTKKYVEGKWVPAKIGDSTLTKIIIHQYTYNEHDSLKEEKIIIQNIYPIKEAKSWITKYTYDKNRNLIQIEQPPYGITKLKKKMYYDDKNRLLKTESNLTMEIITVEFDYDKNDNVSIRREQFGDRIVTTKYQYSNKKLLIDEESEGNGISQKRIRYFYNEFNDVIRKETSYDNKPPLIEEYEYSYYN